MWDNKAIRNDNNGHTLNLPKTLEGVGFAAHKYNCRLRQGSSVGAQALAEGGWGTELSQDY